MATSKKKSKKRSNAQCDPPDFIFACVEKDEENWVYIIDLRSQHDGNITLHINDNLIEVSGQYKPYEDSEWIVFKQTHQIPDGYTYNSYEEENGRFVVYAVNEDADDDFDVSLFDDDPEYFDWVAKNWCQDVWKWKKWDLDPAYKGWPYDYWGYISLDKY